MKHPILSISVALILISSSLLSRTAMGQSPGKESTPAIVATHGAFFAVSVADVKASSRWYAEKLGLGVVQDAAIAKGVSVVVLEGGGLIVELVQLDDAVPSTCAANDAAKCHGIFKAGVLVEDLGKTLEKLAARGVPVAYGPFPAKPNQRANAIIRDNAGNFIQLFEK